MKDDVKKDQGREMSGLEFVGFLFLKIVLWGGVFALLRACTSVR